MTTTSSGEHENGSDGLLHPRSELECIITEIWREVLQRDTLEIRESFFDLGGHSALATNITTKVNERFGETIPFGLVLSHHTVELYSMALNDLLERRRRLNSMMGELPAVSTKDVPL